jgi:23S rRNA (uracil1939-C5)-methyltransferase
VITGAGRSWNPLYLKEKSTSPKPIMFNFAVMNIKKGDILEEVMVQDFAAESKCVARVDGQVIFIEQAAPGDVVDVRVTRRKKSYLEGKPVYFHEFSPKRQTPFCEHYGTCGGCTWQHIQYVYQLGFKHQQVLDQLRRIGHVEDMDHEVISAAVQQLAYRNKLEFTFTDQRWLTHEEVQSGEILEKNGLGFHKPGQFDKVLDIERCYLQPELSNRIRIKVKETSLREGIPFYNLRRHEGFLRNLIIRNSNIGEWMVVLQVKYEKKEWIDKILGEIKKSFPEITSLYYIVNPKRNESFYDLDTIHFSGSKYILEKMEDLMFRISPKSFFQTNSLQAYELYKFVRDFGEFDRKDIVYDLYTGTGTIANFIAKMVKEVIGLDYVSEAVDDARTNSEINKIVNTKFVKGEISKIFNEDFLAENGSPDVIITDPPRAGMHKDVIKGILKTSARKVIYISCNPATQARDIDLLRASYQLVKSKAVDMFPHTHHIENIAVLDKIK